DRVDANRLPRVDVEADDVGKGPVLVVTLAVVGVVPGDQVLSHLRSTRARRRQDRRIRRQRFARGGAGGLSRRQAEKPADRGVLGARELRNMALQPLSLGRVAEKPVLDQRLRSVRGDQSKAVVLMGVHGAVVRSSVRMARDTRELGRDQVGQLLVDSGVGEAKRKAACGEYCRAVAMEK